MVIPLDVYTRLNICSSDGPFAYFHVALVNSSCTEHGSANSAKILISILLDKYPEVAYLDIR